MGLRVGRMLLVLVVGMGLGTSWNAFSGRGFALGQSVFIQKGDELIEAREAKARLDRGALFLDARPLDFYAMGHIPGSLALPEPEFDAYFLKLEDRLRHHFNIVVYCAGFGCDASHVVARRLREKGIQAAILDEGWPAWTDAGYPTKAGAEP